MGIWKDIHIDGYEVYSGTDSLSSIVPTHVPSSNLSACFPFILGNGARLPSLLAAVTADSALLRPSPPGPHPPFLLPHRFQYPRRCNTVVLLFFCCWRLQESSIVQSSKLTLFPIPSLAGYSSNEVFELFSLDDGLVFTRDSNCYCEG